MQVDGGDSLPAAPAPKDMLAMLKSMLLIRRLEEQLGADSKAGKLPGNVHLYIGQEAIAVGVCAHLGERDFVTSTHRGHGHFLAKGGDPRRLVAEVYGKSGGICGGLGGSMHVADLSKGIIGANAIVGGGIGLAAGAALAAQLAAGNGVAVAFFGDGAAGEGILSEVFNIASLWKLPLVLVCEHNAYSGLSATASVTAGAISERAQPYGLFVQTVDGNDVLEVWTATHAAVQRARRNEGPSFIEAVSYRLRGHVESEAGFLQKRYRTDEEIASWAKRDPIDAFVGRLLEAGILTEKARDAIEASVRAEVADAVEFAQSSELPDMSIVNLAYMRVETEETR